MSAKRIRVDSLLPPPEIKYKVMGVNALTHVRCIYFSILNWH